MITPKEWVGLLPPTFEPDYIERAVVPYLSSGEYVGERPTLPMIDLALSKENAAPPHFWGMLYDGWAPDPKEGTTVFITGYNQRGPDNERKKIYASATTPDLYAAQYAGKVHGFLTRLFADANAGKPLMHEYYANYFDLYWDLHLGVTGEAIPAEVREIGARFTDVLGHWYPTSDIVHDSIMRVRALRPRLKEWIDSRVQAVIDGNVPNPQGTFVHYWLQNGAGGDNFRREDIVFECFHNFLAFSQWGGNTLYNTMALLDAAHGDPAVRSWFARTMTGRPDEADGGAFTPLDRFVMESRQGEPGLAGPVRVQVVVGQHGPAAGGYRDCVPGGEGATAVRGGDAYPARAVDPALPAEQVGADGLDPVGLPGVVPVSDVVIASGEDPGGVEWPGDRLAGTVHPACVRDRDDWPQQCLAGHAGPVRALPADQFTLDHGDAQTCRACSAAFWPTGPAPSTITS